MKNSIYLLIIIIILFFACAPKKVITNSKIEQKATEQKDIADTKSNQKEVGKKIDEQLDTDTETVTKETEYDTSKPADPATGKPPIKSEKETTTKKGENKKTNTAINTKEKEDSSHIDKGKSAIENNEKSKVSEKTKSSDVRYYFYILLIGIAGYVFFRYHVWIKSLIKSFLNITKK